MLADNQSLKSNDQFELLASILLLTERNSRMKLSSPTSDTAGSREQSDGQRNGLLFVGHARCVCGDAFTEMSAVFEAGSSAQ